MNALPPRTEMLKAVLRRDPAWDGLFWLGVRTTGIFCRTVCPAKRPRPENVEFFATVREAMFAGYRPCRRCHPLEAGGKPPEWVRALEKRVEGAPEGRVKEGDLRRWGIEPARARRWFRAHYGMTFQAWCRARRLGGALAAAKKGVDVNTMAYDAGYESVSGFREGFAKLFGEAPGRAGKETECIRIGWAESPLGPLLLGSTEEGICLVEFTDRRALETQLATLTKRFGRPFVPGRSRHLEQLRDELAGYFDGKLRRFEVPVVIPGTPFQGKVWEALLRIPYGETRSYEELARIVGAPGASRAVGTANGKNRIAIVVPCHRVVNKNGELGGYGGGLWRKRWLLDLEQGRRSLLPVEAAGAAG